MLKFTTMPKEAISELLMYLAENESFDSLKKLDGGVTVAEARDVLKEVAVVIAREAKGSDTNDFQSLLEEAGAKAKTKKIFSQLADGDKESLLSAFDLLDK